MLGGKCVKCGYNKCTHALEFHHQNNNKEFTISKQWNSKTWELMKKEVKKCILLCSNCHRELHFAEHLQRLNDSGSNPGCQIAPSEKFK